MNQLNEDQSSFFYQDSGHRDNQRTKKRKKKKQDIEANGGNNLTYQKYNKLYNKTNLLCQVIPSGHFLTFKERKPCLGHHISKVLDPRVQLMLLQSNGEKLKNDCFRGKR